MITVTRPKPPAIAIRAQAAGQCRFVGGGLDALQELRELAALGCREDVEQRCCSSEAGGDEVLELVPARIGDPQPRHPPVARIWDALNEPVPFEAVEERGNRSRHYTQGCAQLVHPHPVGAGEGLQGAGAGEREASGAHLRVARCRTTWETETNCSASASLVSPRPDPDLAWQRKVVDAFLTAARAGDMRALLEVLAPDVVFRADVGVAVAGPTFPVVGAQAVAERVLQTAPRFVPYATPAIVNGQAGAVFAPGGGPVGVIGFTVVNGLIVGIDLIADPDKLRHVAREG